MKTRFALIRITIASSLLSLTGCATSSVFKNYPSQIQPVKEFIKQDQLQEARESVSKETESADKIIYLQERGRICALQGDIEASIEDYEKAASAIEENQQKALISASDLGASGASLVSNDNAIPYPGYSHEKVFLYSFQSLNYLEKGSLEGAMVEIRRANNEQVFALQQHEREIAKAEEAAQKNSIKREEQEDQLSDAYEKMTFAASAVKNSFQNAYTFYLSGVLYEMDNDLNNAYISYKKAVEIYPDNHYALDSVFRLAEALNFTDDIEHYMKLFGPIRPQKPHLGDGRLIVLYEDDFVLPRQELKIPFFWAGISYNIAMPYYETGERAVFPLSINQNNRLLGRTKEICSARNLAVKALQEQYWSIFLRQILRVVVKGTVQKQVSDQSPILGLAMAVGAFLTEHADRRSWLTLPDNLQIADFYLPEGDYILNLQHPMVFDNSPVVKIQKNKTTIVRVTRTGSRLFTRIIAL